MTDAERQILEQIDAFLAMPNQSWLFGAGISLTAGIPLMSSLTERVLTLFKDDIAEATIDAIRSELPTDSHIEHILSHLGDYCALADRSKDKTISIAGTSVALDYLESAHKRILQHIVSTIRWGYKRITVSDGKETWKAGSPHDPMVSVDEHLQFANAVFSRSQAGLQQRRGPVRIFTTNYDTLIEDSLALSSVTCWDGFSGGAVAFRSHRFGEPEPPGPFRAHLIKLHGSIDWYLLPSGDVYRIRETDLYPDRQGRVLIYPQATKYVATQRDPFAAQFEILRRVLNSQSDNMIATCGYSYGDQHINEELELGLSNLNSKTTLIAFLQERDKLPDCLENWRKAPWGQRVYVITENGVYAGRNDIACLPSVGSKHDWWTFSGVTKALVNGLGSLVK